MPVLPAKPFLRRVVRNDLRHAGLSRVRQEASGNDVIRKDLQEIVLARKGPKFSERMLSTMVSVFSKKYLTLKPTNDRFIPSPRKNQSYMLYMHVPFCERLCPYCSFNRFPFEKDRALTYFDNMRKEMMMLADLGYDFKSLYVGGGTPTVSLDELCKTIDLARDAFSIKEVSIETNPNHLTPKYLDKLQGRVQRLSVGVQSFDDGLLKQMDRYDKYGSGEMILERIKAASPYFDSMNVDMIFNFPSQTEGMLRTDLACAIASEASQVTFYPLMASPVVARSLASTVGKVDYGREKQFYEIISEVLAGGDTPLFQYGSAWTFNKSEEGMIDEYVVDYEEYPAVGSGGIAYLGNNLHVNTFSIRQYNENIESGSMSLMGRIAFSKYDRMRYRFMMQLFGLRLDKEQFYQDFGCTIETGLPIEMAFMKACRAFDIDNDKELTLTSAGRYLMVVMMRQFFIGVNTLRDQARATLPDDERKLIFGEGCSYQSN